MLGNCHVTQWLAPGAFVCFAIANARVAHATLSPTHAIPSIDRIQAPASLLETLEAHLEMLEAKRKKKAKPKSGSSAATDSGATTSDGLGLAGVAQSSRSDLFCGCDFPCLAVVAAGSFAVASVQAASKLYLCCSAGDVAEMAPSQKPSQRSDKAGGQLASGAKVTSAESGAVSPKVPAASKVSARATA